MMALELALASLTIAMGGAGRGRRPAPVPLSLIGSGARPGSHVISFPVALLDALFLCPPAMMKVHGATLYAVVQIAFAYGFGYLLWAKFVEWRYNTLIYSFLADIVNWAKSLGFVIVVGTAVSAMAWVVSVVSYV